MVLVPGTILGGLPVVAEINCGWYSSTPVSDGEFYSEVDKIYWKKRDGTPGKEIPEHLFERALEIDFDFCDLIEQGFEWLAHRDHEEKEMAQLEGSVGNKYPLASKSPMA